MKENYQQTLEELLLTLTNKPSLLLHSCCAPCSSYVLTYLQPYFNITVLYYNPNIEPLQEYLKRKNEQIRLLHELGDISFMDCDYDNALYEDAVKELKAEREGGSRCGICFSLRLEKTASLAKEKHYDYFGTTLTVSPHKNAVLINNIGKDLSIKYGIAFLPSDFKKKEGYKKSIVLSNEYQLYRQDYCGCKYSRKVE